MGTLQFVGGLIGASRASTYKGLMIARVFHGFGSGVCESLPVQLVNDIFFLHERGKRLGFYTSKAILCFSCSFTDSDSQFMPRGNLSLIRWFDAGWWVLMEAIFLRCVRFRSGAIYRSLLLRGRDELQTTGAFEFHIPHHRTAEWPSYIGCTCTSEKLPFHTEALVVDRS